MANSIGAADGRVRSLPRNSVRPSWSYEIVAMEEQRDAGGLLESNILDAPRRRKRSRAMNEATNTEMVAGEQTPLNAMTVPDAIHRRPCAQNMGHNDIASIIWNIEQETGLKGDPRHAGEISIHGSFGGEQLQFAFPPPGHLQGPLTGTSTITQVTNEVSRGRALANARLGSSIVPALRRKQETNSTLGGRFWSENHMPLPPSGSPITSISASLAHTSCPHGFERLLNNGSTAGLLECAQTPDPGRWPMDNASVNLNWHSDGSIQHARYIRRATFEETAPSSSDSLAPLQSILNHTPVPFSLQIDNRRPASLKSQFGRRRINNGSIPVNPPGASSTLQAILQRAGPIETPIPKRIFSFKSPASRLPITPVSLTSTPTDAHLSGIEDTPPSLSSRQSSDESSSKGTSTLMMLRSSTTRHKPPGAIQANIIDNDTGSNLPQGRKLRGLTNVSVGEADAKSLPPPGPELLKKVDSAKATGEVPVQYESSVVRYVNGKWLAPQMCDSCRILPTITKQSNKLPKCDRGNPCCICTSTGADCPQGKFMTHVFGTRRLSQHLTRQQPGSLKAATGFSLAPHVGQNQNGTWSTSEQTQLREQKTKKRKAEESLMPPIKRRGRPRTTALQKEEDIANLPVDTGDTTDPEIGNGEASSSGDYGTGLRKLSSVDSTPVGSLKRKTATNKSGGSVKYHRSMQEDKPAPYGQPPVWADKRQSLCETLPYYRAYMSGAYLHLQKVRAFMVDKEVGPRDKFEEELIISRVGGGRKLDEQSGHMIQVADQDKNSFALGFQRAMEAKSPVAMIAGQGNRISTSKLPHYYNVLDWFHVTDVWCEKSHGLKCWMVRLEKIRLDTMSWWAPMNSPPLDPNRDINAVKTSTASCSLCKNTSKEIYDAGWACLNTKCDAYFKFSMEIDDKIIEYNKEFMNERTEFTGGPLDPLVPPLLTDGYMEINNNFGYEKSWNAGIVCPMCSGCSRRIEWRQWICETPGCGFTHSVLQRTMKVHDAIARSLAYSKEWFNKETGIKFGQKAMGLYDVYEYILPGEEPDEIAGIIRHFASNGIINGQPDGPNDLFRSMQEKDFGLKRHAARQKDSTGEILTSHFAANWGAPYKYGVTVHSKGFEDAPPVIIKALKRLTWAGQQTLAETVEPFHPFNELLSIGYFEETSIGYHDDGEKELGPTVATLSLGSQALMTLRPKAKCRVGTGSRNAKGTKADVLRMALRHGDLVVMHGTGIQKLYEHAVMPQGMLRFALTCRYVRPELMANDMERLQAEINGKLPNGHEAYAYDGDLGKELIPLDEDLENVSAAQRAMNELSARALAGELNADTLRECQEFLGGLINGMGVPEGRASSPAPSDTPMDDAQ